MIFSENLERNLPKVSSFLAFNFSTNGFLVTTLNLILFDFVCILLPFITQTDMVSFYFGL